MRLQDENKRRQLPWPKGAGLENIFVDIYGNLITQSYEAGQERLRTPESDSVLVLPGIHEYTIRKAVRLSNGEFAFLIHTKDAFATGYTVVMRKDGAWIRPFPFSRSVGTEAKQVGADFIEMPNGNLLLAVPNFDGNQYLFRLSGAEARLMEERIDLAGLRTEDARLHVAGDGRIFFAVYGLTDSGTRQLRVYQLYNGNKLVYREDFPKDEFIERNRAHKWSFEGLSWHRDKNGVDSLTLERPTGDRVYSLIDLASFRTNP